MTQTASSVPTSQSPSSLISLAPASRMSTVFTSAVGVVVVVLAADVEVSAPSSSPHPPTSAPSTSAVASAADDRAAVVSPMVVILSGLELAVNADAAQAPNRRGPRTGAGSAAL